MLASPNFAELEAQFSLRLFFLSAGYVFGTAALEARYLAEKTANSLHGFG